MHVNNGITDMSIDVLLIKKAFLHNTQTHKLVNSQTECRLYRGVRVASKKFLQIKHGGKKHAKFYILRFTAKFHKETICEFLFFCKVSRRHDDFVGKSLKNLIFSWLLGPGKKCHFLKYTLYD